MIGVIVSTFDCNLSCKYCYEHIDGSRVVSPRSVINDIFERNLRACEEYATFLSDLAERHGRTSQIILHGGEPLLIDLDNLEKLFERITATKAISIQIQTNGTLVSHKTAELLHKYNIGVVISLDGPQELHDSYRNNMGGANTYSRVIRSVDILREYGVDVSALVTITDKTLSRIDEIFSFFTSLNMDFSVNRCFAVLGKQGGITEQEYKSFLSVLFDLYSCEDEEKSRIRIPCFDRCFHDLKKDSAGYYYNPEVSPLISVFSIPSKTWRLVEQGKGQCFFRFSDYQEYIKQKAQNRSDSTVIRYSGALKECVITHLCEQQYYDFLNAQEIGEKI